MECIEEGCSNGIATGHALHRVSPKGTEFEGKCDEHFEGDPDEVAQLIQAHNHKEK
jgi:hypothetical protein